MFPRSRALVAACTATAAFVGPAAAHAATKTVDMGTPPSAQKALGKYSADVNAFFPSTVAVHVGDKVSFAPVGFHNVEFPKKGGSITPLLSPGAATAGNNDAAGTPFWFNGQPQFGFTPSLAITQLYGKSVTLNAAKGLNSGLPLAAKPKPFSVKFTKAGTYTYFCDIHPGMKGTVKVLPKSKSVPSAKADKAAVAKQVAAALKEAKKLAATVPSGNTIDVGEAGKNGVEAFSFFPANKTVPVGTTVTFQMTPSSFEVHTATTGPGDPEKDPTSYLGKLAASLQTPTFDLAVVYPSTAPGTDSTVTPTSHGNGFWNSGAMDESTKTPLPTSSTVRFDAPGTYQFYCMIHPFMHGTVTVQ